MVFASRIHELVGPREKAGPNPTLSWAAAALMIAKSAIATGGREYIVDTVCDRIILSW